MTHAFPTASASSLRWSLAVIATVTLLLGSTVEAEAAYSVSVLDDGFEASAPGAYNAGSIVSGWMVERGSIDIVTGPPQSGRYALDINGGDTGSIATNISVIPGREYALSFAFTKNPEVGPVSARVTVNGSNLLTVAVDWTNAYAELNWHTTSVVFQATTAVTKLILESLDSGYGGVYFDTVRVDTPQSVDVFVNGALILSSSASSRGPPRVDLHSTFHKGTIFFTVDGSDPSVSGLLFDRPFIVRGTSLLRTVTYNEDFSESLQGSPVQIDVLPTLAVRTDGGGSVLVDPPAGAYFSNSQAVVTATSAPGWTFLQWLCDASGTNPTTSLAMTRDKSLTAVFGTSITTNVVGSGVILIGPSSTLYPFGTEVRLTAVPQTGNYFAFWGSAASGTNNPLSFTLTIPNPTITAAFASLGGPQSCALTVISDGWGQVTAAPPGNRFGRGTNVVLTAIPDAGQSFTGWGGDGSGTNNPLTVTVSQSRTITANFTKRPFLQGEGWPALLHDDGFRVTLKGEFGERYRIDGSTNLTHWTPLVTLTNDFGTVQFTDGAATNVPRKHYRAAGE